MVKAASHEPNNAIDWGSPLKWMPSLKSKASWSLDLQHPVHTVKIPHNLLKDFSLPNRHSSTEPRPHWDPSPLLPPPLSAPPLRKLPLPLHLLSFFFLLSSLLPPKLPAPPLHRETYNLERLVTTPPPPPPRLPLWNQGFAYSQKLASLCAAPVRKEHVVRRRKKALG